jgi:hypothetical protein
VISPVKPAVRFERFIMLDGVGHWPQVGGKIPFLHVKSENGAKVVYQKIGFHLSAAI